MDCLKNVSAKRKIHGTANPLVIFSECKLHNNKEYQDDTEKPKYCNICQLTGKVMENF